MLTQISVQANAIGAKIFLETRASSFSDLLKKISKREKMPGIRL